MRRIFRTNMPTLLLCLVGQILGYLLLWLFYLPIADQAHAASPITPSGLNTQVNLAPTPPPGKVQYDITGGTRPGSGTNLFHSFGDFNVPNNNIANFLNNSGLATSNILGRVTGGNISNIFGTIQTTGFGNANLFMMNPAGFLFGPNATLNVGGMVAFTSADYLRLADGALFNAIPNPAADALISAAPVAAFGFLGSNPGAITVQGSQFTVTPGTGISLVGGNITVQNGTLDNGTVQGAKLSAPGGQINLASVASPGEVVAATLNSAPNVNGQSFGALGSINISQQSAIDVSGNGGGTVRIRGGNFVLDSSTISSTVTGPAVGSPGAGINIAMKEEIVIQNGARITTLVTPGSNVKGGDITLDANSILVQRLGGGTTLVETTTLGSGNGGKVSLHATGDLTVNRGTIDTFSVLGSGNAGDVEIRSSQGNISMTSSSVSSQANLSNGRSGSVLLDAPNGDISLVSESQLFNTQVFNAARGNATLGDLTINAQNLTLVNAAISGDNITGNPPGNIIINLSGNLSLGGTRFPTPSFIQTLSHGVARAADLTITAKAIAVTDGAFLSTETFRSGSGGHLNISTDNLQLTNGAQIRSGSTQEPRSPLTPPNIPSPPPPTGPGGNITIKGLAGPAQSVLIDGAGSGVFTNTQGTGAGGNIFVNANGVTLQNGAHVSSSSTGTGPNAGRAGDVTINAGNQFTMTNSSVTTEANQSSGGAIKITTNPAGTVELTDSVISASVLDGTGGGGSVNIDPQFVLLQNSQILANAVFGPGGNIFITSNLLLPDSTSIISASSQFGQQGTITIQQPIAPASGKIIPLPQKSLVPISLLSQRCAALAQGNLSSFTVAGRDNLPAEPSSWLSSPLALAPLGPGMRPEARGVALGMGEGEEARDERRPPLAPPYQGGGDGEEEIPILSLRRIAPPGFLTQTFAVDGSGCTS